MALLFRTPKALILRSIASFGGRHTPLLCADVGRSIYARQGPHAGCWLSLAAIQQQHRYSTALAAARSENDSTPVNETSTIRRTPRRSRRLTKTAITGPTDSNHQQPPGESHSASQTNSTAGARIRQPLRRPAAAATAQEAAAEPGTTNSNDAAADTGTRKKQSTSNGTSTVHGAYVMVPQPLPRVLMLHTGGTLGMDINESFDPDPDDPNILYLKKGTGGSYGGLVPGDLLANLLQQVPELQTFANLDLQVVFNKDSSNIGPKEWLQIAKLLDKHRQKYDAFLVVHGTDTMAYTASALSLMLLGFKKPIVMTGSQLPLSSPRSDARQNLIDALTCATAAFKPPHVTLSEVAVCFGGKLMRGNRAQKVDSSAYQAFDTPNFPHLATLGVGVEWNDKYLLRVEGSYRPRFKLEPAVIRVPIVPGSDPRICYGDLVDRGVRGIVLEAFGVGNMPDLPVAGWIPWLRQQTKKGLQVYMASQCHLGLLHPELYKAGAMALEMGVEAGPQMTPECAVVKLMLCLAHPDIPVSVPLAGEM